MKAALVIGHTEKAPGARSQRFGISEYQFNEPLVLELAQALEGTGLKTVVVYRDLPNEYSKLPGKVNRKRPDFIVEFHANAAGEFATGTEMLYWHSSTKGKVLAGLLQTQVLAALGLRDRGLKAIREGDRGALLLRQTKAPCSIAEPFFISQPKDLMRATAQRDDLLLAYKAALLEFAAHLDPLFTKTDPPDDD